MGSLKIDPKYEKATNKLKELDMMQYSTCLSICNISDRKERDKLFVELAKLKMQMLRLAQNPELEEKQEQNTSKNVVNIKGDNYVVIQGVGNSTITVGDDSDNPPKSATPFNKENIKLLLGNNQTIDEAIELLQKALPANNELLIFQSQYNQLKSDIRKGIKSYSDPQWNSFMSRLLDFVDDAIK